MQIPVTLEENQQQILDVLNEVLNKANKNTDAMATEAYASRVQAIALSGIFVELAMLRNTISARWQ